MRMKAKPEAAGPERASSRIRTWKMEAMSLGQAVWIGAVPDSFGGISRDVALHGHHRRRAAGRHVASVGAGVFFFPVHSDHGAATGYTLLKSVMGKGENPIGVAQIDRTRMGGAGDWLCGFIPGRLRVGGVVHGLGAEAWIRAVCGVSDRGRNSGAGVRRKTGGLNCTTRRPVVLILAELRSALGGCSHVVSVDIFVLAASLRQDYTRRAFCPPIGPAGRRRYEETNSILF